LSCAIDNVTVESTENLPLTSDVDVVIPINRDGFIQTATLARGFRFAVSLIILLLAFAKLVDHSQLQLPLL